VAVIVRAGAAPLWWPGLLATAVGAFVPGLTGRRIGLLTGAALFLVTAAAVAFTRAGRYAKLADGATRAGRGDFLQDRDVTVRNWRRGHRWWLLGAFVAAVGSAFVLPGAGGLVLAGAGAGLWAKAVRIGQRERRDDALYWVRTDWAGRGRPAGRQVKGYRTTGPVAGDAAPGGARRRRG
jgi:4-amino-4-deoxy-L-arabinose transferase-like glycosyltransferase